MLVMLFCFVGLRLLVVRFSLFAGCVCVLCCVVCCWVGYFARVDSRCLDVGLSVGWLIVELVL